MLGTLVLVLCVLLVLGPFGAICLLEWRFRRRRRRDDELYEYRRNVLLNGTDERLKQRVRDELERELGLRR